MIIKTRYCYYVHCYTIRKRLYNQYMKSMLNSSYVTSYTFYKFFNVKTFHSQLRYLFYNPKIRI